MKNIKLMILTLLHYYHLFLSIFIFNLPALFGYPFIFLVEAISIPHFDLIRRLLPQYYAIAGTLPNYPAASEAHAIKRAFLRINMEEILVQEQIP